MTENNHIQLYLKNAYLGSEVECFCEKPSILSVSKTYFVRSLLNSLEHLGYQMINMKFISHREFVKHTTNNNSMFFCQQAEIIKMNTTPFLQSSFSNYLYPDPPVFQNYVTMNKVDLIIREVNEICLIQFVFGTPQILIN